MRAVLRPARPDCRLCCSVLSLCVAVVVSQAVLISDVRGNFQSIDHYCKDVKVRHELRYSLPVILACWLLTCCCLCVACVVVSVSAG